MDDFIAHYTYDGGNVLAEYAENGDLLRKYLYGPGIDEPISMTEVVDSNAVYYYHTDGLGSVIALSNADGNSVQAYEYSIYGLGTASDPNHTNPYMFAGRRFDVETGLYYNRARYYNPYIGRFMQTDPIGYGDGMNWYAYTGNNPTNFVDSSGLATDYSLARDQIQQAFGRGVESLLDELAMSLHCSKRTVQRRLAPRKCLSLTNALPSLAKWARKAASVQSLLSLRPRYCLTAEGLTNRTQLP